MCERSPKAEVRNPKETRSAKGEKKGAGKAVRSGGFRPSFGLRDSDLGLLLRARIVLPLSGPMIENGAVRIRGNRIAALGRWCCCRAWSMPTVTWITRTWRANFRRRKFSLIG